MQLGIARKHYAHFHPAESRKLSLPERTVG